MSAVSTSAGFSRQAPLGTCTIPAADEQVLVGVDLGGTKTAGALVSQDGTLLSDLLEVATPADAGPDAVLDATAHLVARVCWAGAGGSGQQVVPAAVGVGAAGVIDSRRGLVTSATEAITGWTGTDVAAGLSARLDSLGLTGRGGAPPPVHVINDVNAYAAGEAWLGAGSGASSALVVAVGTGVGGAVVVDGHVLHGAHYVAGEMGHVPAVGAEGQRCTCGREGHLEAVAAGPQIVRRYREAVVAQGRSLPLHVRGAQEIERLAEDGDVAARQVYEEAAVALGRAVAGAVTLLDPEVVIVSGGLARSGSLWWTPLRRTVHDELIDVVARDLRLVPAALGTTAPVVGAAHEASLRLSTC